MIKNIVTFILIMFSSFAFAGINGEHFITDEAYRNKVNAAFDKKIKLVGTKFFQVNKLHPSMAEQEALHFLYAYMPLADVTDYSTAYYLDNVRQSFITRQEMSWGKKVPELLFRHFVLPIRVNNENLDNSRKVFYKELKDRIKDMSMYDAILEVNHWCHEKVTYQPSDARTLSPLATVSAAYGRCGEQSTFTVSALRAVGIPARQVYTPRWAHTDDNHAWVEAWADGKWYFLGACEPEPVLNLGWFNAPASRAMLMHTRVFGDYDGPEEVMLRTNDFTEINLIDNYGSTGRTDFLIVDSQNKPVNGARVDFKIYNYAEYCTVASKYTDADGRIFLTAGEGDMMVWASKDGWYGYSKTSFGKDKLITIKLDKNNNHFIHEVDSFDIVPPAEHVVLPAVTKEQREHNQRRFAYEDSLRHAYMATFYNDSTARVAALSNGLPADKVVSFLVKSSGNHATILQFLTKNKKNINRAIALLSSLSDKDLKDMPMDILEDNFTAHTAQICPRVENEMIIHPFKNFFETAFTKEQVQQFRSNPASLVKWVKDNIRLNPDKKSQRIAQTPIGVWNARLTDTRSRAIFFVDLARSLGIEARKDPITQKTQYKVATQWVDVNFDSTEQTVAPTGKLMLGFKSTKLLNNPKYYSHFTISKVNDNGTTSLLSFDEGQVDMGGGLSWESMFKNGVSLDAGTYILVTGTRLANGSVLSEMQNFQIKPNKTTDVEMKIRTTDTEVAVIGNFDSESKFQLLDKKEVSILSQTGRGYFIVGLIGVGQEPTNHALRDIAKVSSSFDSWNRPLLLLFENETEAKKFKASEFGSLPKNVIYGIDKNGAIRHQIATQMKLNNEGLSPIFFIADTFNRVVYVSQGYTIGLGEQMERVIKKLE